MHPTVAFDVGGLGFEFCVFVASWRHALRSEWPFINIFINASHQQCQACAQELDSCPRGSGVICPVK